MIHATLCYPGFTLNVLLLYDYVPLVLRLYEAKHARVVTYCTRASEGGWSKRGSRGRRDFHCIFTFDIFPDLERLIGPLSQLS
jgi:hypothetical protein